MSFMAWIKDIWQKILQRLGKNGQSSPYPSRLVPTKKYKLISNNASVNSHHLGKWVAGNITLKDTDGTLNPEAIDVDDIPGFSTNKIPKSTISDLDIVIHSEYKKSYNCAWEEGTAGIRPDKSHFYLDMSRQKYYIKVSSVDGFSQEYLSTDKNPKTLTFVLKVCHAPLIVNYHHFEFKVFANGVEIKRGKTKTGYKRIICALIRAKVQSVAVFDPR
jgi:hypothetical protein